MRHKILILFVILILLFTGCKERSNNVIEEDHDVEETVDQDSVDEENLTVIIPEGIRSPLSGLYAPDQKVNRRIVAVMYDNHPQARWQAGLKDAEIIYEMPVEYPYTRYMAFFLINDPDSIGPIRSARPYFITKAIEFDSIYVRVGGSEEAKADIRKHKIADIDGLTSSNKVFWRQNHKKAPNNLYSSMEAIRQTQDERGYRNTGTYEGLKFFEEDKVYEGYSAKNVIINYRKDNITEYIYNDEEKNYERYKDGRTHIDEADESVIKAKNIIIQETNISVIDNVGRLRIDLIGEGKGKYITNGAGIDIKWVKNSKSGKTYYLDGNGNEISLNPGTTWIQIVNKNLDVIIE